MDPEVQPTRTAPAVPRAENEVTHDDGIQVVDGARGADGTAAAQVGPWSAPAPDFDRFCATERAAVVGLAFALCGDWGAAEDLAQDAFFAAYRQWSRLASYDHPGAWVRRVGANRAVSRRRRLVSEAKALTRLGGRRRPSSDLPPIDDEVWAAVRRLPARQAQVFALTYVDDLSLEQVGGVLQISPGTAKTHLQRARAALAASLTSPPTSPDISGGPQ
jgi:RNA polymerase sigma-70 factor (ECF subfamily)